MSLFLLKLWHTFCSKKTFCFKMVFLSFFFWFSKKVFPKWIMAMNWFLFDQLWTFICLNAFSLKLDFPFAQKLDFQNKNSSTWYFLYFYFLKKRLFQKCHNLFTWLFVHQHNVPCMHKNTCVNIKRFAQRVHCLYQNVLWLYILCVHTFVWQKWINSFPLIRIGFVDQTVNLYLF